MFSSRQDWYGNPILLWKPTVEPEVRGVERFLTAHPYDLIKQKKFKQVPLILGVTQDEFGGVAAGTDAARDLNIYSLQLFYRALQLTRMPPE